MCTRARFICGVHIYINIDAKQRSLEVLQYAYKSEYDTKHPACSNQQVLMACSACGIECAMPVCGYDNAILAIF